MAVPRKESTFGTISEIADTDEFRLLRPGEASAANRNRRATGAVVSEYLRDVMGETLVAGPGQAVDDDDLGDKIIIESLASSQTLTSSTALDGTHIGYVILVNATSGAKVISLPASASADEFITIRKSDTSANAVTVETSAGTDLVTLATQHDEATYVWWGGAWVNQSAVLGKRSPITPRDSGYGAIPSASGQGQRIIDSLLAAVAQEREWFVPEGEWLLEDTGLAQILRINTSGAKIRIRGAGCWRSVLKAPTGTKHVFGIFTPASVEVEDLGLDCSLATTGTAFNIQNAALVSFNRVRIYQAGTAGILSNASSVTCESLSITNCEIDVTKTGHGIALSGEVGLWNAGINHKNVIITNNRFRDTYKTAMDLSQVSGGVVFLNNAEHLGVSGYHGAVPANDYAAYRISNGSNKLSVGMNNSKGYPRHYRPGNTNDVHFWGGYAENCRLSAIRFTAELVEEDDEDGPVGLGLRNSVEGVRIVNPGQKETSGDCFGIWVDGTTFSDIGRCTIVSNDNKMRYGVVIEGDARSVKYTPSSIQGAAIKAENITAACLLNAPRAVKAADVFARNVVTAQTWGARAAAAANSWFRVVWVPEYSRYVAVSITGTGDRVMTSPDGDVWTSRTSAADNDWRGMAWAPELGRIVVVGSSGTGNRVMTSDDGGITWTSRTSAADYEWRAVCWSPERRLFVAVASTGTTTDYVMTSPDGATWTLRTAAAANQWFGVCWSAERQLFVAVSITGTGNRVMTSPDGVTWTSRTSAADNDWRKVVWCPELSDGLFVAVGSSGTGNRVMTSPDAITWTTRTSAADNSWQNVIWAAEIGLLAAVSSNGTGNRIMTSTDGVTWTSRTNPEDNSWLGLCWSPEHSKFVAVAQTGTNRVMVVGSRSGVYTPTLTGVANVAASTASATMWTRVDAVISVAGKVNVDPTTTGATQLGMSLPVTSAITAAEQIGGVGFAPAVAGFGAAIVGDATNDRAEFQWVAVDTAARDLHFSFNYRLLT